MDAGAAFDIVGGLRTFAANVTNACFEDTL